MRRNCRKRFAARDGPISGSVWRDKTRAGHSFALGNTPAGGRHGAIDHCFSCRVCSRRRFGHRPSFRQIERSPGIHAWRRRRTCQTFEVPGWHRKVRHRLLRPLRRRLSERGLLRAAALPLDPTCSLQRSDVPGRCNAVRMLKASWLRTSATRLSNSESVNDNRRCSCSRVLARRLRRILLLQRATVERWMP